MSQKMKMTFSGFIFLALAFSTQSQALLPPYYQSAKEINAILNNEDIANKITSGRVITKIERTDHGWRITANDCTLDVLVSYSSNKSGMVGPAEFEVSAGKLVCENSEDTD